VFHVPALGSLGRICVRRDRTWSSMQELDLAAVVRDARLLSAALTAAHPPSVEADSQVPRCRGGSGGQGPVWRPEGVPARQQTRLCGGDNRRRGTSPAGGAARRGSTQPRLGIRLRAAHWMIRDHSFVRTTSINAFVATKRLSKTRRATLDYLGVGDPVLAQRNAALPSGGQFAARGSVPVQSGALTTLPELPGKPRRAGARREPVRGVQGTDPAARRRERRGVPAPAALRVRLSFTSQRTGWSARKHRACANRPWCSRPIPTAIRSTTAC